jgi:hypothetical protein
MAKKQPPKTFSKEQQRRRQHATHAKQEIDRSGRRGDAAPHQVAQRTVRKRQQKHMHLQHHKT